MMRDRLDHMYETALWLSGYTGSLVRSVWILAISKILKNRTFSAEKNGARFVLRVRDLPIAREVFDFKEYDFVRADLKTIDSPYIVDVGAHIGLFVISLLGCHPQPRFLSIEASGENYRILEKNARLVEKNHMGADWQIVRRAAWGASGMIDFSQTGNTMSYRVAALNDHSDASSTQVQTITLENIVSRAPNENHEIDLMKIDIEGSEENFLSAFPELLSHVKRLVMEIHPALCSQDKIMNILKTHYTRIDYIKGRENAKPLLYCR